MAFKHQDQSYRTWKNERWVCWGDFSRQNAQAESVLIRGRGGRVRSVQIGAGMVRLFVPQKPDERLVKPAGKTRSAE